MEKSVIIVTWPLISTATKMCIGKEPLNKIVKIHIQFAIVDVSCHKKKKRNGTFCIKFVFLTKVFKIVFSSTSGMN